MRRATDRWASIVATPCDTRAPIRILLLLGACVSLFLIDTTAEAATHIRKQGSIVAEIDGRYLRKGSTIVAQFDGDKVRSEDRIVAEFDGRYLRREGSIVVEIDDRFVRQSGAIVWEIRKNGDIRKGGSIHYHVDGGVDSEDMMRKVVAYLLLFAD